MTGTFIDCLVVGLLGGLLVGMIWLHWYAAQIIEELKIANRLKSKEREERQQDTRYMEIDR